MPESSTESERSGCTFLVVAVAGSDGAALRMFAASLRHDNMAYLVMDIAPGAGRPLTDVLRDFCMLPVLQASGRERLQPNVVYVLPTNSRVMLRAGELRVVVTRTARLSQAELFGSLAGMQGAACAGITLSGFDHDASDGLSAIRKVGGAFFVYDPGAHSEQPLQLADGTWCTCINPARIRDALCAWQQTSFDGRAFDPMLRARLLACIEGRFGVDLSLYESIDLRAQVAARMTELALEHAEDYVSLFERNPDERRVLLPRLVIGTTSFFRDPWVFDELQERVFPELLAAKRDRAVRMWITGCSTGEEVYSIAITLLELLARSGVRPDVRIFATDVRDDAVEYARRGVYAPSIQAQVAPPRLARFFVPCSHGYQVRPMLRDIVLFKRHDVLRDPPFAQLDLVSCRNLLIYLGRSGQQRVLQRLSYALLPGATLLLGHSESARAASQLFLLRNAQSRLYTKPRQATPACASTLWLRGGDP